MGEPAQAVGRLVGGTVGNRAGRGHLMEIGRTELEGMEGVARWGVEPGENSNPVFFQHLIVPTLVELIKQPRHIGLLTVLEKVVGPINNLVGIPELVPIIALEWALVAELAVPLGHGNVWIKLPRIVRVVHVVVEIR